MIDGFVTAFLSGACCCGVPIGFLLLMAFGAYLTAVENKSK